MLGGGYLSEYDAHLGRKLAYIICGGDVPAGTEVTSSTCSTWKGRHS